jgi:hypothetical protein
MSSITTHLPQPQDVPLKPIRATIAVKDTVGERSPRAAKIDTKIYDLSNAPPIVVTRIGTNINSSSDECMADILDCTRSTRTFACKKEWRRHDRPIAQKQVSCNVWSVNDKDYSPIAFCLPVDTVNPQSPDTIARDTRKIVSSKTRLLEVKVGRIVMKSRTSKVGIFFLNMRHRGGRIRRGVVIN